MKISAEKTHYTVIGVPPSATAEEIRSAYLRLAKSFHPDTGMGKKYQGRFAEVTAAYAVLRDDTRRRAYDATLALLTKPCPVCKGEGQTYRTKGFTQRIATRCAACEGHGRIQ